MTSLFLVQILSTRTQWETQWLAKFYFYCYFVVIIDAHTVQHSIKAFIRWCWSIHLVSESKCDAASLTTFTSMSSGLEITNSIKRSWLNNIRTRFQVYFFGSSLLRHLWLCFGCMYVCVRLKTEECATQTPYFDLIIESEQTRPTCTWARIHNIQMVQIYKPFRSKLYAQSFDRLHYNNDRT